MKIPGLLGFFLLLATSGWAQTTVWRAADNPHVVTGTYTVAAGETLVLEPGVEVRLEPSAMLHVLGRLEGAGSLAARITITGDGRLQTAGSLDLSFADIKSISVPDNNGVLVFRDCRFSENGWILNGGILQFQGDRAPYVQLDRCSFTGDGSYSSASLYVANCTVVVRDTSFTNASFLNVSPGYLFVDRVTSIGSTQFGLRLGSDSDLFVNNVSVTNATEGGLQLAGDTRNGSNVLIGPDVTLEGNGYPVHLTKSGLHPESSIPATGNKNNLIRASEFAGGGGFWPNLGIPYYVDGSPLEVGELLWIQPGVIVKMAPYSYLLDYSTADGLRAFGTEAQPILFERADPAQPWYSLIARREKGGRIRHAIVDGSSDGVQGGVWYLENIIFRNNRVATEGGTWVSGSQYLNNDIGHSASGVLNNLANPNAFEGNRIGVSEAGDARNVWWGSPTGPRNPRNPGGAGDVLEDPHYTEFQPFLTARPDFSDAPPEVKLARPSFQLHPGTKVTLRWDSKDDDRIVAHKILFSPVSSYPSAFQEVATLPADQQTYEWTVPNIGFQVAGADAWIRVVAMDSSGKEGFDEWELMIPTNTIQGEVTYDITAGQTFQSGEMPPPLETVNVDRSTPRGESYVEVIGVPTRRLHGRGQGHGMPFVSTDTARFVVSYGNAKNRQTYWYSPLFKIRPDAQLGDAPPAISLTTPQTAQDFPPGSVIPITWNASDDEGLRSFAIVASYDGARTWQPVVGDLPGSARSYNWQTAPGTGYGDLRIMVIATDWRFQTSSDGRDRVFSTNGGATAPEIASLSLNPATIANGESSEGVVTLNAPAPAGGAAVAIGHNGYMLITAPANITIPAGATSGTFTIKTTNVEAATTIQISVTCEGVTKTAELTLSLKLANLDMPSRVPGGSIVTGSVALSGAAPAGGSTVSLTSADPGVMSVPATVTVLEGEQSASFSGTAQSVSAQKSIVISGEYGGTVKETTVTITPSTGPPAPTPTATPSPAPGATPTPSPTPSSTPSPTPTAPPVAAQPLNIATRGRTESGDNTMIGGFIITGNAPKKVVVRAIGPSLPNSLSNALSDPELELRGPEGLVIRNDNWQDDSAQAAEIISNQVAPIHELESAIVATLAPGSYTAAVTGRNGVSGVALMEVYDLDAAGDSKLANISTRGLVQSADDVLIGGFILGSGSENTRVLLRATGPSLADAGVNNPLSDPTLELRDSQGALLRSNDAWKEEQAAQIEATTIAPLMDSEAAIIDDLPPGAYTAIVAGKGASGVGLIEIYNLR